MSFILDALKKSESDRQRQSGPSLFEVKVAPPRRTLPVWALAIAVLLGINVIVVSWMLLRHAPAQQPAAAPAATARAMRGATTAGETAPVPATVNAASTAHTAAAASPSPAAPPEAVPAATPGGRADSGGGRPATMSGPGAPPPRMASGTAPPSGPAAADSSDYAPAIEPAAAQGSAAPEAAAAGGLPLYQQIVTSAGLPALHLDLHVFAASPKDRFVMINMTRLGEGDALPNGVQVDAIRPDGVVLSYHGTRFLLPRD